MIDKSTTMVQGEDVLAEVSDNNGADWYKLVCLTKQGFEFDRPVNEVPTQCGVQIGKKPYNTNVPIEGAVDINVVDELGGYASYKKMQEWAINFTALMFRQIVPTGDGSGFINKVNCYMVSLKVDIPVDNLATWSAQLKGFGAWATA